MTEMLVHLRDGSLETPSLPLRVSKPILVGLTDVRTIFANIDLAFHRKNRTVFFGSGFTQIGRLY